MSSNSNSSSNSNIASPANQPALASTNPVRFQSWVSVYRVFQAIEDSIPSLPEGIVPEYAQVLINDCISSLYAQHVGEPAWDTAYTEWVMPSDDDPYVDESSPILK